MFLVLILFLIGIITGSFLNCVIYRLEIDQAKNSVHASEQSERRSFLFGHSYCPNCKHILSWLDLIPILSFFLLKGKCRYCSEKISWQYPFIEVATGLLFLLIFYFQPSHISTLTPIEIKFLTGFIYYLIISCFLIVIFVYDLKHYIIPDKIIYPAIVIALIFNFQFLAFNQIPIFISLILSAFGAAAFFLLIVLISQGKWMGIGDIKLAFLMGLILGWPGILVALFLAFLIGALVGLGLIIRRKKTLKSQIPFAPFLVVGTFVALFLGRDIINWYLGLINA